MARRINLQFLLVDLHGNDKLIEWLMDVGLIANRYECFRCKRDMILQKVNSTDGYIWRCQKDEHSVARSVRKNTWFSESKLSMREICMLTYMWILKVPNKGIMMDMGVSSRTLVSWNQLCRDVCVELCTRGNGKLGGQGVIVEIEVRKFGKRKYKSGHRVAGKWVFGGLERGSNKYFMLVVNERNKAVLLEIIKEYIFPGSIIISDCWKAYDCLKDEEYVQLTVNHSIEFKNRNTDTNSAEGIWGNVKRRLGRNYCKYEFNSYFFEYLWRRRHSEDPDLMMSFIEGIKIIYPIATHD